METFDFVRDKLTEWGLSELIERFEDERIDKKTFLSLEESDINALIPKIGPRVKFRKRLREYLQLDFMETSDFVRDKLTEWGLSELIQRFEDKGINEETFLCLEESDDISVLIPKIGPRIKFRKKLREYLQASTLSQWSMDSPPMMDIDTDSSEDITTEMDPTMNPLHFESTSTMDSDTDEDPDMNEEPLYPGSSVTHGQGLLAVMLFILRHHLTEAILGDFIALLNFLIPNMVVASQNIFSKIFGNPALSRRPHFYCKGCQKYLGKNPDNAPCVDCNEVFNKESSTESGDFFLSVSLKHLLKDILRSHGTQLLLRTTNLEHDIDDVMNGMMYQNWLKQGKLGSDDLTLSWNCDGVPISDVFGSVWVLQFTVNELPCTQRRENVMVAGLWFGQGNPKMNTFLKPFIDDCCDLALNPMEWIDSNGTGHSSKVFSLICSSDAVARPLLRNCKQYNGEYGCDWCLHPGTVVKKGKGCMRSYPYDEEKQLARSEMMFKKDAIEAQNSSNPKNGVKGISLLSVLPMFNIVFGFVPDYLHTVLVGVSKQLMTLWLDPCNSSRPWFIGQQISQMDTRLFCLKPPCEIGRSPRSLKLWDSWKASEWRAFLLFYSVSVLPGILPDEFLQHYFLLSFSMHILLQASISQHALQLASDSLILFVVKMNELYGEENVSFNCHQLIHLTESVRNWGPLWATSAFSFERNSSYLQAAFRGSHCAKQIYQRFLLWQQIPRHLRVEGLHRHSNFGKLLANLSDSSLINDDIASFKSLGKPHNLELSESIKLAVEELLHRPLHVRSVETYDGFSNGNIIYHTTNCSRSEKRDNSVVKLKNECCGEIILILKESCLCMVNCLCQKIPIIVVHLYDIKSERLFVDPRPGISSNKMCVRVEKTKQPKAFFIEDIRCKCMYVDGWLVPLPNPYEPY